MKLADFLSALTEGKESPDRTSLLLLSNPSAEELDIISSNWPAVPAAVKLQLIETLEELAEDDVTLDFSELLRLCMTDEDADVRARAVDGLWECEDRTLVRPLIRLLSSDPAPRVRAAAAMALGHFAERAKYGKLIARDTQLIKGALADALDREGEETQVTRRALESLSHLESGDMNERIEAALDGDDPLLRQSAVYAAGNGSHLRWLPRLIDALGTGEPAIRYEAAGAIGRLGDDSAVPCLVPLLGDDDTLVRQAAATALGQLGGQAARDALARCLDTSDEALDLAAGAALAALEFENDPLGVRIGE